MAKTLDEIMTEINEAGIADSVEQAIIAQRAESREQRAESREQRAESSYKFSVIDDTANVRYSGGLIYKKNNYRWTVSQAMLFANNTEKSSYAWVNSYPSAKFGTWYKTNTSVGHDVRYHVGTFFYPLLKVN